MRRPLYITELAAQPFPNGLIGRLLMPYQGILQKVCFSDNENGDAALASDVYGQVVVAPVNAALQRNGKSLRLDSICVEPKRHHTIKVSFHLRGDNPTSASIHVSLFQSSKKAIAMERRADEDGEEYAVVAPRRGSAKPDMSKVKRRPTKKKTRQQISAGASSASPG